MAMALKKNTEVDNSTAEAQEKIIKTIWAVAGGKGGTGKTLFTANLSIGLAAAGYKVLVIDADLGVPNLHNYYGLKKPEKTIDDFLTNQVKALDELIVDTNCENLKFISGGTNLIGIANLQHQKKQKLLRHINKLSADIILVDLGAGISYNTIDFFNLSSNGIIVTNPEPNASQDAYFFLKNAAYRRLKTYSKGNQEFNKSLTDFSQEMQNGTFDFLKFYEFLPEHSKKVNADFTKYMGEFKPHLVVNKVRQLGQMRKGKWFKDLVLKFLHIEMHYVGNVVFDKKLVESSEKSFSFILKYPKSKPSKNIFNIITNLVGEDFEKNDMKKFRTFVKEVKKIANVW